MSKLDFIKSVVKTPQLYTNGGKHIFLLSHMRGNTSLLSHIIGSHKDIAGYYEQHINYKNFIDLYRMRFRYFEKHGLESMPKYFFDKILHNSMSVDKGLVGNAKILISIRNPHSTVASIVRLFSKKAQAHEYQTIEGAEKYLLARYKELQLFASNCSYHFIDADKLTNETDEVLGSLSRFLDLDTQLSPTYELNVLTGVPGAGDSSEKIKTGTIVPQKSIADIAISDELQACFEKTYEALQRNSSF